MMCKEKQTLHKDMHYTYRQKRNNSGLTISLRNEKYGMLVYGKEKRIRNQPIKFIKSQQLLWHSLS